MRSGLHEATQAGDCKKVSGLIAAGVQVDEASPLGHSPLFYALSASEPSIASYRAIILLLEAGANPLQPQPGDEFWKETHALLSALRDHHLAQVLLLLWYVTEDYKTIKLISTERYKFFRPTFERYIQITAETEAKEGKDRDYARWINETAADAKEVRVLLAEAKGYLEVAPRTVENAEKAARCYKEAARIYQKHEELEDSLVYFRPSSMLDRSATPKQLHALLKEYYRNKKLNCLANEFNCIQLIERALTPIDEAGIRHHTEVINRLIELSKLLGKEKEADLRFYLGRAAEMMMRLPDRRVAAATPVSHAAVVVELVEGTAAAATTVSDEEVAVEFVEGTEGDESALLLADKPVAATTSFFAGFSKLRRRPLPVAAAGAGHHSSASTLKG